MNSKPPAVTTGPLRINAELPVSLIPCAARPGVVPIGLRHLMVPLLRS